MERSGAKVVRGLQTTVVAAKQNNDRDEEGADPRLENKTTRFMHTWM